MECGQGSGNPQGMLKHLEPTQVGGYYDPCSIDEIKWPRWRRCGHTQGVGQWEWAREGAKR